tara:strand:- start:569 stop:775 length:207 start_codon:yes stop_codon:yes gene_type:complete
MAWKAASKRLQPIKDGFHPQHSFTNGSGTPSNGGTVTSFVFGIPFFYTASKKISKHASSPFFDYKWTD